MALSSQGVKAAQLPRPIGGIILKPSTMILRSFCGTVILYSPFFSVPFMPVACSIFAISNLLLPGGQEIVSFFKSSSAMLSTVVVCWLHADKIIMQQNK